MAKYRIVQKCTTYHEMWVEADTEEAAIEKLMTEDVEYDELDDAGTEEIVEIEREEESSPE